MATITGRIKQFFSRNVEAPPPANLASNGELTPRAYASGYGVAPVGLGIHDGEKFAGGFGDTVLFFKDYWTLRTRSNQVFTENPYARGIIKRLVTNQINTGLAPESIPVEGVIGVWDEDRFADWTEDVELRFGLWGKNPQVCDFKGHATFGALQRAVRSEALISGDILVVMSQSSRTKLPQVNLVDGSKVRTPLGGAPNLRDGHIIRHGVEIDKAGRQVAYWVTQTDLTTKRVPARGSRTGRRIAWLVYGTDKRLDEVRGEPILGVILQSLKEIDKYKDSTQRKAVINSLLAMQVTKSEDKLGTLPLQGGAVKRDQVEVTDSVGAHTVNLQSMLPGFVIEEMQHGEKVEVIGGQGTDVNFGPFEEAIVQGIAWSLEIPPEILRLSFSNNYSASQAAINEFKIAINLVWGDFGETFCTPVYTEWLLSEVLLQRIDAPTMLEAWRDPQAHDVFGAWVSVEWYGSIKPSTDMVKQVKASEALIRLGLSTYAREARVTTGTKHSQNVRRLKRENEQLVEANRPQAEAAAALLATQTPATEPSAAVVDELESIMDDFLNDRDIA